MISFLIIFLSSYFITALVPRKYLALPIILMAAIAMIRGNVGYDTCNYKQLFYEAKDSSIDLSFVEPGFLYLTKLVGYILDDSQAYLAIINIVEAVFLIKIAKQVRNWRLFLILYISCFYYAYFYSLLRQALATMLFVYAYALYLNGNKSIRRLVLLTPLIHLSVAPVLVLFPSYAKNVILIIISGLLLVNIGSIDVLGYLDITLLRRLTQAITGGSSLEQVISWHVYASYLLMLITVLISVRENYAKIAYVILVPVMMFADQFTNKAGRVGLVAMTCLLVYNAHNWRYYGIIKRMVILFYYIYSMYAMTIYPIINGHIVQEIYPERINTVTGEYHIWITNDKHLCPY